MFDEHARYDRRLRRLGRAARRWSVLAGALVGAAATLTPYAGVGLPDAFWAAAAGGSAVLACWRWVEYRALAAHPVSPARAPDMSADRVRRRVDAFVTGLPWGREALSGLRRQADRRRLRGCAVLPGWRRLDRAETVLVSLQLRRGGPAETAALEAAVAERELRELANRAAAVERGLPYSGSQDSLEQAHRALIVQFERGVAAYEELVAAAAAYVAEEARTTPEHPSLSHLADATDLLRGIAHGFTELRRDSRPAT
jgi:hypothetical protein